MRSVAFPALLLLAVAPPALAQTAAPAPGDMRLTRLIGALVSGADQAPLGVVNDVLLTKDGKPQAIVIAVAGARGLGDKDVAIRPDDLSISPGEDGVATEAVDPKAIAQPGAARVRTKLTQDDVAKAPAFETPTPTSAGTPESSKSKPKSSTQSGGPG